MKQFRDVKEIAGNSGKKMPYFLIIIKSKRQFLIMSKNLISHIMLNLCSHQVTIIGNKEIAETFQRHHCHHDDSQLNDNFCGLRKGHFHHCSSNIANHQRYDQRDGCSQHSKKHICPEKSAIRLIISRQLLQLVIHFHSSSHKKSYGQYKCFLLKNQSVTRTVFHF